jgi:hypothetical protein
MGENPSLSQRDLAISRAISSQPAEGPERARDAAGGGASSIEGP